MFNPLLFRLPGGVRGGTSPHRSSDSPHSAHAGGKQAASPFSLHAHSAHLEGESGVAPLPTQPTAPFRKRGPGHKLGDILNHTRAPSSASSCPLNYSCPHTSPRHVTPDPFLLINSPHVLTTAANSSSLVPPTDHTVLPLPSPDPVGHGSRDSILVDSQHLLMED